MKPTLLLLLLCFLLASCLKEANPAPTALKAFRPVTMVIQDVIPDGGCFKVRLQQDSDLIDETELIFDHDASLNYLNTQDAPYFTGFGIGSLANISTDGISCAIKKLPFVSGRAIDLNVKAKESGTYILKVSYVKNIPTDIGIWLKDAYLKDSLNLRKANYSFQIIKSDTSSFGASRFKVVLK